jgi:hypothetical protein
MKNNFRKKIDVWYTMTSTWVHPLENPMAWEKSSGFMECIITFTWVHTYG